MSSASSADTIAVRDEHSNVAPLGAAAGVVYLLCLISGVSGLVYEVVWLRKLSLVFSVRSDAMTTVLTAFLAGLALGAYVFGRVIERSRRPMFIYAYLEFGIACSGAVMFVAIGWLEQMTWGAGWESARVARFAIAFAIMLVPTMLMGGTLPVLCRAAIDKFSTLGLGSGLLYALNTLGGATGCFLAGYVLIGRLGLFGTNLAAMITNVVVGVIALIIAVATAKNRAPAETQPEPQVEDLPKDTAGKGYPRIVFPMILVAFALSGFAALGYEVLWTRVLAHYMSSMTYAFSLMLAVYLLGLVIGCFVLARLVDHLKNLLWTFGVIQLAIAISVFLSIYLMMGLRDKIAVIVMPDYPPSWLNWFITMAASAIPAMLIPTILIGTIFPIVSRFYTRNLQSVGRSIGTIYAANTFGSILGAFCAGFFIVPMLGISNALRFMLVINVVIGMAAVLFSTIRSKQIGRLISAAVVATLVLGFGFSGGDFARRHIEDRLKQKVQKIVKGKNPRMVYFGSGRDGTVSVLEAQGKVTPRKPTGRSMYMFVNGTMLTGSPFYAERYMRLSGHLPALLAKERKRGCIICFGTGITASALAHHKYIDEDGEKHDIEVDAVELSAEVLKAAKMFASTDPDAVPYRPVNDTLYRPNVNVIRGDGRHFMLLTEKMYDIITLEPPPPREAGVVNLYSKEFYEMCKKRLTDGGIMYQWFPLHSQTEEELKWLYMTFLEVFPDAQLWVTVTNESFMVGSKGPIDFDYGEIARRIDMECVADELDYIGIFDADAFLSCYFTDGDSLWEYCNGPEVNLDVNHVRDVYDDIDCADALKKAGLAKPDDLMCKLFGKLSRDEDWAEVPLGLLRERMAEPALKAKLDEAGIANAEDFRSKWLGADDQGQSILVSLDEIDDLISNDLQAAKAPDTPNESDSNAASRGKLLADLKISNAKELLGYFFSESPGQTSGDISPSVSSLRSKSLMLHLDEARRHVEEPAVRSLLRSGGIHGFDQLCIAYFGVKERPAPEDDEFEADLFEVERRIRRDLAATSSTVPDSEKGWEAFSLRMAARRGRLLKRLGIESATGLFEHFFTSREGCGRGPVSLSMSALRTKLRMASSDEALRDALEAMATRVGYDPDEAKICRAKTVFKAFDIETCPVITDDKPIIEFFPITEYDWSSIRRNALANLMKYRANITRKVEPGTFGDTPEKARANKGSLQEYCNAMRHLYYGYIFGARGNSGAQRQEWLKAYKIDTRNPYFGKMIKRNPTKTRSRSNQ